MAPEALTPAQTAAAASFAQLRGVPVFGPFWPLIRSPELMLRAHEMGFYLRYNSSLPFVLSEMAILLVSRHWSQPVEWEIHRPAALKAGLPLEVVEAIADDRRPAQMEPAQAAVYDVFDQLHRNRGIDDALYARASELLGEQGLIDLAGVAGYYTLLAMTMNIARTKTAGDDVPPLSGT
jgi:4-carboxymuconolactone decarboxylase